MLSHAFFNELSWPREQGTVGQQSIHVRVRRSFFPRFPAQHARAFPSRRLPNPVFSLAHLTSPSRRQIVRGFTTCVLILFSTISSEILSGIPKNGGGHIWYMHALAPKRYAALSSSSSSASLVPLSPLLRLSFPSPSSSQAREFVRPKVYR